MAGSCVAELNPSTCHEHSTRRPQTVLASCRVCGLDDAARALGICYRHGGATPGRGGCARADGDVAAEHTAACRSGCTGLARGDGRVLGVRRASLGRDGTRVADARRNRAGQCTEHGEQRRKDAAPLRTRPPTAPEAP